MTTPRLSATVLHRQFLRFRQQVLQVSGEPFRSFNEGEPHRSEGYKEEIYREGRSRLASHTWKAQAIGSGDILRSVINAIEINVAQPGGGKLRNNLVAWDGRRGPNSKSHRSLLEALTDPEKQASYEKLLFNLYRDQVDPGTAFDSLVEVAGRRYDFLAYLFFLKDLARYMPIASSFFEKAFDLLGVDLKTAHQCSWENYRDFNAVLQQVRSALRDEGLEDVRLIDAHSFCWMLARFPEPTGVSQADQVSIAEECDVRSAGNLGGVNAAKTSQVSRQPVDWQKLHEERSAIGRQAEEIAFESEKQRLRSAGRSDLVPDVRIVSGDHTLGYDIRSFNTDGSERCIEVKSVRDNDESFLVYITENEFQHSQHLPSYYFYFVFGTRDSHPRIRAIRAERLRREFLSPVLHVANLALV